MTRTQGFYSLAVKRCLRRQGQILIGYFLGAILGSFLSDILMAQLGMP